MKKNKILILDVSGILYTYHYALKLTRRDGTPSGALYGFLYKLKSLVETFDIKYVYAGLDVSKKSLERVELFKNYKADRKPMPEELKVQFQEIGNFLDALNIKSYKIEGQEADDVIGSIAENLKKDKNNEIYIFTKDKDMCQLLDENVFLIYPTTRSQDKGIQVIKTEKDVLNKMGVFSYQITNLFGLIGDKSDGIPGVHGVGETVKPHILKYGTIENLIEHIDEVKFTNKKRVIENLEEAKLSRQLATINRNIDLDIDLSEAILCNKTKEEYHQLCKKWDFKNMINSYDKFFIDDVSEKNQKYDDLLFFYENEYGVGIKKVDEVNVYLYSDIDNDSLFSIVNSNENIKNDVNKILLNNKVICYNIKKAKHEDFKFKEFEDISIIYHLTNENQAKTLDEVYSKFFNEEVFQLNATKYKKLNEQELVDYKTKYITERLKYTEKIFSDSMQKLETDESLMHLYKTLEKPLIDVLYDMEEYGIQIDEKYFNKILIDFEDIIATIKNKIYNIAMEEFNIDSPKQLSEILFTKLQYPVIKKNKSTLSTDIEVLETLKSMGYEIAEELLNYRKYNKLLMSYIKPLLEKIDNESRIHTTFNQNGTSTGRLSSENPNLQVIPSRTEEGFLIRKGLVAKKGYTLLSCDYSQIELRVLASLSRDKKLIEAYDKDLDLHTVTARKLFNKTEDETITREERNIAKTINFSVLYGKTPFGLSKELNISVQLASKYINNYFKEYEGVKKYIDKIVENAKIDQYVETLFGTKRQIPDINSSKKLIYEKAKRMAINTVIQGTASNILKKVMLELNTLVSKDVKMLIQIHDELIFEIKTEKIDEMIPKIVDIMENTIKLGDVKLKVHYEKGKNWSELK